MRETSGGNRYSLITMFSSDIHLHNPVVCMPFIYTATFTNRSMEWLNTIKKLFHSSYVYMSFTTRAYRVGVRNDISFDAMTAAKIQKLKSN